MGKFLRHRRLVRRCPDRIAVRRHDPRTLTDRMVDLPTYTPVRPSNVVYRAREVLAAFLFTFIAARVLVYLIMAHKLPNLYAHVGGTHVHHLNYGIFLLTFVGAYLIFAPPRGAMLSLTSILYGIGLGLTFDEFGMWLHLDTTYW